MTNQTSRNILLVCYGYKCNTFEDKIDHNIAGQDNNLLKTVFVLVSFSILFVSEQKLMIIMNSHQNCIS